LRRRVRTHRDRPAGRVDPGVRRAASPATSKRRWSARRAWTRA
jgi:hypothetical protein